MGAAAAAEEEPSAGAAAIPLSALRPDLDCGWPAGARWHAAPAGEGPGEPWLEQLAGEPVRYRLSAPAGARLRGAAALGPGVRRARMSVTVAATGGALDRATARWRRRLLRRRAATSRFGLELPAGESVVTLEVRGRRPRTLFRRRPTGVWTGLRVEMPAGAAEGLDPLEIEPEQPVAAAPAAPARPAGAALVSILMPVHDPAPEFLEAAIDSVGEQTSADWQLCIADDGSQDPRIGEILADRGARDPRVVVGRHPEPAGIAAATNLALQHATGAYVALLDHDDVLAPGAVAAIAAAVAEHPGAHMLYSDEDHLFEDGSLALPYRKPDWSPDLFRSIMFVGHLGVYGRALVAELGGFRSQFDGSQDYDLILRVVERTARIVHVPEVLYHWRVHPGSASSGAEAKPYAYKAAQRAIGEHLSRTGVAGQVAETHIPGGYRIEHDVDPATSVTVLAPVGDEAGRDALGQALAMGGHEAWELVVLDPGAGFAAALAQAASAATAECVLLLDGPVAACREGWLRVLVGFALQEGVGAAGAKLVARDGRVDSAGVIVEDGLPLAAHHGAGGEAGGVLWNLQLASNALALDGAAMVCRERFERLGGLDPRLGGLALADWALRAHAGGLRNVLAPDALLRRTGPAPVNDLAALAAFRSRWRARGRDPYYNPAYGSGRADFR